MNLQLRLIVLSIFLFLISIKINATILHGKTCNTIGVDINYCLFKEQILPSSRASSLSKRFNVLDIKYRGVPIMIKTFYEKNNNSKEINIKIKPVGNASAYYYIEKRNGRVENVIVESQFKVTLSQKKRNLKIFVLSDSTSRNKASLDVEINGKTERIDFITHVDSNYCRLDILTFSGKLDFNSKNWRNQKGKASISYQSDTKKKLRISFENIQGPPEFMSNNDMVTKLNDSLRSINMIKQKFIGGNPSTMKKFKPKQISKDHRISINGAGRVFFNPYLTDPPKNVPAGNYYVDAVVDCL